MPHIAKNEKIKINIMLAVFILSCAAKPFTGNVILSTVPQLALSAVVMYWIIDVQKKVIDSPCRRLLSGIGWLTIFNLALQIVAFHCSFENILISDIIWYLYYMPVMYIPVLALFTILSLWNNESSLFLNKSYSFYLKGGLILLISTILFLGILTNNIHQLAFHFIEYRGAASSLHVDGPVLILSFIWIVVLFIFTVTTAIVKCRIVSIRKKAWIPLLPCVLATLYLFVTLALHYSVLDDHLIFGVTDLFCFMSISFMEACIQVGFIPSNSDYEKIFEISDTSARIVDDSGRVIYSTTTPLISATPGDIKVQSHKIRGGRLYWSEDMRDINNLLQDLEDTLIQLSEENTLIHSENQIKKQKALYELKNRLYTDTIAFIKPEFERLKSLMPKEDDSEDVFNEKLTHAALLCVYVKRRANLAFIADDSDSINIAEVKLALRETSEFLKITGIQCNVKWTDNETIPAQLALQGYDSFKNKIADIIVNSRVGRTVLDFAGLYHMVINYRKEDSLI